MNTWKLRIPLQEGEVRRLRVGDVVYLSGRVFTGRSLFHIRAVEQDIIPPVAFEVANVMMHVGPVMHRLTDGGWEVLSMTPTSSIRFERHAAEVIGDLQLRALIGKTTMGERTAQAMCDVGCVHLTVVGVCGNTLAKRVRSVEAVHFREELGNTEATWEMELDEAGPFIVDMDTCGANLFHQAYARVEANLAEAYARFGIDETYELTDVRARSRYETLVSQESRGDAKSGEADMNLGNRREIFVDRYLIDRMEGTELRLHEPQPAGKILSFEDPWATSGGYVTVLKDGAIYRMYYMGTTKSVTSRDPGQFTCYAESPDGKTWVKPNLSMFEVLGHRDNNVVHNGNGPTSHNFSPFIDTRAGVPEEERYKALAGCVTTGLLRFVSPDGIQWRQWMEEPILPVDDFIALDSQNVSFWSESEGTYVCYLRVFIDGIRSVARTTSDDFRKWAPPAIMSFGDTPLEHLYINQTHPYFRAPHIYIGLAARFMQGRKVLSDDEGARYGIGNHRGVGYWQDCSEGVLLTSRGGNRYHRTFMEGFIKPGLDRRNWGSRCNYPALGVVPTGEEEMSLYVKRHNKQASAHLERLTLRTDGFASVRASYVGGEMTTKPFIFAGAGLWINYSTGAGGHIRVEMQNPEGRKLKGFGLEDSDEIIGDEIERAVSWRGSGDVSSLVGQLVRIRFSMKDADLYALQFR